MKKNTEKQPIDDLFARKLSNMSLPPSADGFERLQARMGQGKPEARVVFWRNPAMQRYMAAAACLVLVCLFGWLYGSSGRNAGSEGEQLAVNQNKQKAVNDPAEKRSGQAMDNKASSESHAHIPAIQAGKEQLALVDKTSEKTGQLPRSIEQPTSHSGKTYLQANPAGNVAVVAQTKPAEIEVKQPTLPMAEGTPTNETTAPQVAEADNQPAVKANPPAERVLVVTIEEPATLVAARQVAKEAMQEKALATNKEPEKEAKAGLWQQVKRFKQGEVFARRDNSANDEQGLLGRAYSGLKHSLEKDKSVK